MTPRASGTIDARPQRDRVLDDTRERATERRAELVDRAEIERDYAPIRRERRVRCGSRRSALRLHHARARALSEGRDVDARLRLVVGATQEPRRHGRVVLHAIRRDEHELEAAHDGARERVQKVQVRAARPDEHEAAQPGFRARRGQRPCPAAVAGTSRSHASKPPSALLTSAMPAARSTLAAVTLREPLWQYVTIGCRARSSDSCDVRCASGTCTAPGTCPSFHSAAERTSTTVAPAAPAESSLTGRMECSRRVWAGVTPGRRLAVPRARGRSR